MPLCTTCTQPLPHLYTVYQSAHNVRLERCVSCPYQTLSSQSLISYCLGLHPLRSESQTICHEFADPYVAHDLLVIILDLILLKRGVYRHLLFNRGSKPRRVDQVPASSKGIQRSSSDDVRTLEKNARDEEREREKVCYCTSRGTGLVDRAVRRPDGG